MDSAGSQQVGKHARSTYQSRHHLTAGCAALVHQLEEVRYSRIGGPCWIRTVT
jgi:hypothetical protein